MKGNNQLVYSKSNNKPLNLGRILLIGLLASLSFTLRAQNKGSIELELAGVGGFGSVSYVKTFASKDAFNFEYRFGLSYAPIDRNNGAAFVFPIMAHATYGSGKHLADFGIGQAITVTTRGSLFARMPISFGYRFDPNKRVYYRFAYTPIISYIFNFQWEHWGGVTFGFKLGKL